MEVFISYGFRSERGFYPAFMYVCAVARGKAGFFIGGRFQETSYQVERLTPLFYYCMFKRLLVVIGVIVCILLLPFELLFFAIRWVITGKQFPEAPMAHKIIERNIKL